MVSGVDFKLWKRNHDSICGGRKENIQAKLISVRKKRAVIINIALDHNMQITSSDNGRIIEIPYLYRLDRKEIGIEIIAKINREEIFAVSIRNFYSNELLASFEYSNIDRDYDFYYVTTSDKYIK